MRTADFDFPRTPGMTGGSRWLAVLWLVNGVPVGAAGGLLLVASDHAREHVAGATLLVLSGVALLVGAWAIRSSDTRAPLASLATSALWLAGAVVVFLSMTFTVDRLLFGGVPALVGCLTGGLALAPLWRARNADTHTT